MKPNTEDLGQKMGISKKNFPKTNQRGAVVGMSWVEIFEKLISRGMSIRYPRVTLFQAFLGMTGYGICTHNVNLCCLSCTKMYYQLSKHCERKRFTQVFASCTLLHHYNSAGVINRDDFGLFALDDIGLFQRMFLHGVQDITIFGN